MWKKISRVRIVALLLTLLAGVVFYAPLPAQAQGAPVLELRGGEPSTPLAGHLLYLENQDPTLDVTQAFDALGRGDFAAISGDKIDFGYSGHTYWMYTQIHFTGKTEEHRVYDLDHVRMADFGVYLRRGDHIEALAEVDGHAPFNARAIKHRLLLAEFELAPDETVELMVKYKSYGSTYITPTLSSPDAFSTRDVTATMLHSLLIGALLLLALYNLMMYVMLKSAPHIWYVLFVVAGLTHVAHQAGFTFVYLWPNNGALNAAAADILGAFTIIFVVVFFRSFLNLKTRDKALDIFARLLIGAATITIIVCLVDRPPYIGRIGFSLASLAALLGFISSTRAYWRGFKPARFAALGWGGVLIGAIYVALSVNGLLPALADNNIIFEISMLFEGVMFSASLADFVTDIRHARDKSRKQLIKSLEAEADALTEAAAKGQALSAISHDIRQPIHALKLYIKGMRNIKDPDAAKHGLDQMDLTINSLDRLLSSVMDSAEPESNGEIIVNEAFSANRLIASSKLIFAPLAEQKGLVIKTVPSSLKLLSDRGVMMRILNNIVSNAVKYTDRGKILIGCRRRGSNAVFQIHDTGRGIPDELLKSIFGAYNRVDSQKGNDDSHGLGLSIVKKLADRIGATIEVQSKSGMGTLFEISVPMTPDSVAENTSLEGLKAIIIDDNTATLDELDRQLEGFGMTTVKGQTFSDCIDDLPSNDWTPNIIISDLHLADDTNGVDQARLAYDHFGAPLPTLILTFDRLAKARQLVSTLEGAKMLYKPIESHVLNLTLKDMLG